MTQQPVVVISQARGRDPAKRGREETVVAAILRETAVEVLVVPDLYDVQSAGPSIAALKNVAGDLLVLSWLYPRASYWLLAQHGIQGEVGRTRLSPQWQPSDEQQSAPPALPPGGIAARRIYCFDLRECDTAEPLVAEIQRILGETADGIGPGQRGTAGAAVRSAGRIEEPAGPRWYPVIDYGRCTNCMECLDFCLFGVYGVDRTDTILVEQPDNCRKGCPACSRVCPEHAILFPQHKMPAIAGGAADGGGWKMDLSQLFGAPPEAESPLQIAARERDAQPLPDRDALGGTGKAPDRGPTTGRRTSEEDLDHLVDELDQLDL